MAKKDGFDAGQVEILLSAVQMYINSMERRVTAEKDADARAVWQKKSDNASVLLAALRQQ